MKPFFRIVTTSLAALVLFAPGCSRKAAPTSSEAPADGGQLATRGEFGGASPSVDAAAPSSEARAEQAPRADEAFELEEDGSGAVARRSRPGLGTQYGEQRSSSVVTAPFVRGGTQPDVLLSLFYDDMAGIRHMSRQVRQVQKTPSSVSAGQGMFVVSLVDDNNRVLPGARVGDRTYAIGMAGQRYRVGIENHSNQRFEVVASVDGLDVVDGGEAAFEKRGYILEPLSSMTVDGWRTSNDTVAAFRFSSLDDSYADRTGRPRNVGVIGVAFFHEEGQRTAEPDPFPNRFAPPPPRRQVFF